MSLDVDCIVEQVRLVPTTEEGRLQLAAMLSQSGRHFHRLSGADAEFVRGHILARFERCGVPESVLPKIIEELRTSISPVVLAGAARAIRRLQEIDENIRTLLIAARERIAFRDEYVSFDVTHCCSSKAPMSARQEITATLEQFSSAPRHCCGHADPHAATAGPMDGSILDEEALNRVEIEDHAGRRHAFAELLRSRTSLLTFFYTRCMNPNKCSLTVARFGQVARYAAIEKRDHELQFAAVSYDGEYDDPARLLAYGRDRGFPFGDSVLMVRCVSGWSTVRRQFDLQVGYGGSTVNNHARELFLVKPDLSLMPIDAELLARPTQLMMAILETRSPNRAT
ncbi:thioredoxin-like protein (plasmid) [Rhizobium sp. CIAT894]|uniref:SCO family protein n=1 Tax=Rhizobium sp. CIAT894 TaxID=2020312 RepID=UPI000A1FBE4A|nr:SCO family protein [Rhizobium sp. CIAT894]ARM91058.1 thioredoxin-like protein [Rhizobium sp. CIAT894]